MGFDAGLAERIREILGERSGITERRMFGGLAFMLHGNMFVGILGTSLMARVGPDRQREALSLPHVREMDFTGRPMKGYVFVDAEGLGEDEELESWVSRCIAFVRTLPAKARK